MIFYTEEMFCYHLIVMNIILVSADLPEFVHRTERCPIPNNITDWRRSSKRLGCKHDILSNHAMEQKSVYHCLPTNYLNETVEFCGKNVPSDGGYCPVYTYEFGINEAPNFANCTGFSEGCPKKFFFSKQVFKYPACNDISKKDKCYRLDPNYCSESCGTKRNKSNVQENIATRDMGEFTRIMVVLSAGMVSLILLIFVGFFILTKYMKGTEYIEMQTVTENVEFPELSRVKLDDFLFQTGQKLDSQSIARLKFIFQGRSKDMALSDINNGEELLKCMDEIYDFSMNIYILQGFLERINEDELVGRCLDFAKEKKKICPNICYKRENIEGYKDVSLKLPDDEVHTITIERISALTTNLMNLIDAKFDDIVVRGISEGCVIIHTNMRPISLSKIEKLGIYAGFIFEKYKISKVYTEEQCFYPSQNYNHESIPKEGHKDENCSTTENQQSVFEQISELLDLPDSLNHINIAIMRAPFRRNFSFVNACTKALESQTVIHTRASLTTNSSNSTAPLTVISSKTKSGRAIQIRILESEAIQTIDSVVDFSTCANEASTCSRSLSELDRKIHCFVYALDPSEETPYGLDGIDYADIKKCVENQEIPKLLLLWTQKFSKVSFQDMFKRRVQVCDEFQLPLRLILPAYDPLSSETHTNEALQSLLYMINRAIKYASEKSQ